MRRRLSSILSMITLKRSRNAANLRARDFDHLRKNQRLPQDTLSRYQHKPTLVRNASSHSTDSLDVALKASLGRVCFQEPDLWHAPLSDHMVYLTQSFTDSSRHLVAFFDAMGDGHYTLFHPEHVLAYWMKVVDWGLRDVTHRGQSIAKCMNVLAYWLVTRYQRDFHGRESRQVLLGFLQQRLLAPFLGRPPCAQQVAHMQTFLLSNGNALDVLLPRVAASSRSIDACLARYDLDQRCHDERSDDAAKRFWAGPGRWLKRRLLVNHALSRRQSTRTLVASPWHSMASMKDPNEHRLDVASRRKSVVSGRDPNDQRLEVACQRTVHEGPKRTPI